MGIQNDFNYQSKYIKKKYNIDIPMEIGILFELMAVEYFSQKHISFEEYSSVHMLNQYIDEHNKEPQLYKSLITSLLLMLDVKTSLYFLARWIYSLITKYCHSKADIEFITSLEQYFDGRMVQKDCIELLINIISEEELHDQLIHLRNNLSQVFNQLLSSNYFMNLDDKRMIFLFLNVWRIIKVFFPSTSPISIENKENFASLLKKVSQKNRELNVINMAGLDFSYVDFSNTDLAETLFYDVDFSYCRFTFANLDSICWSGSNLSGADFESAFMECSHLEDCNCQNASFKKAHLLSSVVSGADFTNSNFENTNFMECDADRIIVKGMKIDDKTAFNGTDLRYVNWEDVDISGISISENEVSHFWEVVNYTRNTILYDAKFRKLENQEIQKLIYKELRASSNKYLSTTKLLLDVQDVFISYASDEKQSHAFPLYSDLRNIQENGTSKYSVWIDDKNLTIGNKLRLTIESIIKKCKLAIIFFSNNYANKGWTKYELYRIIQEYKERNLHVILVLTSTNLELDLIQELRSLIPSENQFYCDVDYEFLRKVIVKKVQKLLEKEDV